MSNYISNSSDRTLRIRLKGSSVNKLSSPWEVQIPPCPEAPTTCKFIFNNPSYVDKAVLVGTTSDLEYTMTSSTTWVTCEDSETVLDLPTSTKTYYFRKKSDGNTFPSMQQKVLLYAPDSAPHVPISMRNEEIYLKRNTEYCIDDGEYTLLTENKTLSLTDYIESLSGSNTCVIKVRYSVTDQKPASRAYIMCLNARRAAPTTVTYFARNNTISGATKDMEYREVGTERWYYISSSSPFSVISILNERPNVVLEFRYKFTTTLPASYSQQVTYMQ